MSECVPSMWQDLTKDAPDISEAYHSLCEMTGKADISTTNKASKMPPWLWSPFFFIRMPHHCPVRFPN